MCNRKYTRWGIRNSELNRLVYTVKAGTAVVCIKYFTTHCCVYMKDTAVCLVVHTFPGSGKINGCVIKPVKTFTGLLRIILFLTCIKRNNLVFELGFIYLNIRFDLDCLIVINPYLFSLCTWSVTSPSVCSTPDCQCRALVCTCGLQKWPRSFSRACQRPGKKASSVVGSHTCGGLLGNSFDKTRLKPFQGIPVTVPLLCWLCKCNTFPKD